MITGAFITLHLFDPGSPNGRLVRVIDKSAANGPSAVEHHEQLRQIAAAENADGGVICVSSNYHHADTPEGFSSFSQHYDKGEAMLKAWGIEQAANGEGI